MNPGILTRRNLLNIVIHLAAWSAFVSLLALIVSKDMRTPYELLLEKNPYFIATQVFTDTFLIGFFYLNSFVLIPKFLATKRIWLYFLIIGALLAFYLYVPEYIFRNYIHIRMPGRGPGGFPGGGPAFRSGPDSLNHGSALRSAADSLNHSRSAVDTLNRPGGPGGPGGPPRVRRFRIFPMMGSAALFLLVFIVSTGAKILQQWFLAEHQKEKAEKEKLRTELSLLKSQVNPHFLFNTLNNIYAMAITNSEHTADAVMKLSQIMRYILQDAESEYVPLQKDLDFLQRYIELQQFRLSNKVDIKYSVTGSPQNLRIAPLLLIPFVENAFKYGVSARQSSSILIDLNIRENIVTLWVENSKHAGNTAATMDNTGIGISNTRRRLDLLYPGKHELIIKDSPDKFEVSLKIVC